MSELLETIGPAIGRASWQATALAIIVVLLLRCFGERLAARWRYLLWGIVLVRFLFVITPASPWSVFNLVQWNHERIARATAQFEASARSTEILPQSNAAIDLAKSKVTSPQEMNVATHSPISSHGDAMPIQSSPSAVATTSSSTMRQSLSAVSIAQFLTACWLAGCLLLGLKLLVTASTLRRRLSACRPVTDATVLALLATSSRRIGLKRTPALLVTPEWISPCIVGTWAPKIILPESIVTQSSTEQLGHVLAHELAHLVRGDLWTNWLLLAVRILHWFNPVAWWTVREMQAEREAACDELAFSVLGETDRTGYAATIVELAASLSPSALAPGFIGFFSSSCRLRSRVERLLRSPSVTTLRAPLATSILLGMTLIGLTDSMPDAQAQTAAAAPQTEKKTPETKTHTVSGRCLENEGRTPLAGVVVKLYRLEGRTSPPVEIAKTTTGADGRYEFTGLVPPRRENHLDRLRYGALGFAPGRPVGTSTFHFDDQGEEVVELIVTRKQSTLSGTVVDDRGKPIAGASVFPYIMFDRPAPDILSATTDANGQFKLENLGVFQWSPEKPMPTHIWVRHPDYPETSARAASLPANLTVKLTTGCLVTGTAIDNVKGHPAAGVTILARRSDEWGETFAVTDAAGKFRLVIPEGSYDFLAAVKDRVCIPATDQDCLAGEKFELPPLQLIGGGLISGQVINTATGQPVAVSKDGKEPISLGLFGPSQPPSKHSGSARLAEVDETGRFTLRAAPGENFPYLVNFHGDRMTWNTRKQPPVIVKEGETTTYNMLITPEVPAADKLQAARKLVAALPKPAAARTEQILVEFRKLNHTVDECELWCLLMRELVAIGRDAVPQLCAELDTTTNDRMLRRLAFALRAIGDARAVPALIQAIPRTLLPSSSDFGLVVKDKDLAEFMQKHDLGKASGGTYFDFDRPVREIAGALHNLTKQNFDDIQVYSVSLSEDPRRQILQRRLYTRQAQRWQEWWDANSRTFTDNEMYQTVKLTVEDRPLPPATQVLTKTARLKGSSTGIVVSPAIQAGTHVCHFYDLDTGYDPRWPAHIPRDESPRNAQQLTDWAMQNGVDLMCITHRATDGTETYVLRALGMKVQEIDSRQLRNIDKLIAAGTLSEGRPVGELLMHFDPQSQQLIPNANGAFLFVTQEGNWGLIETTDRITQTADLSGLAYGSSPPGVGFHKGVQFNLRSIVP